jgi:hypothetical protein
MGWLSPRSVFRRAKKATKKVTRAGEKLVTKAGTELVDTVTGSNKYTRRGDQGGGRTAAQTAAPREQSEEVEAAVESGGLKIKKKRKGKRALIAKAPAANVAGEGKSGLNIPKT